MVPTTGIRGQRNYLPAGKKSLHQIFYDFKTFFLQQQQQPFSPRHYFYFFFYCGHEHDITSMERLWSTHWFLCIMTINGDPKASCFSLFCYWGDFFSSFHTHRFISKTAPYAPMCVIPIHLKCTIPSLFFFF